MDEQERNENPSQPDLRGKVAIVTGASAGIGRAYALALAGAGATVIAAARTLGRVDGERPASNTLDEVVKAGEALPGRIYAQVCDVELETDLARVLDHAVVNHGRVDVLVNNAAVMKRHDALDVGGDEWDRIMRVNVRGPYLAIRLVAPHMIRRHSGSIVNVTARAAGITSKGDRAHSSVVYAGSKAALNRLTHFMAEELKPFGIAVNTLSPGIVLTDTAAAARADAEVSGSSKAPTPEVLGPALLCLAAQTAETLTGHILHTDDFPQSWP